MSDRDAGERVAEGTGDAGRPSSADGAREMNAADRAGEDRKTSAADGAGETGAPAAHEAAPGRATAGDTTAPSLVTVPRSVSLRHVLDETVLLNSENGVYYGLNDSGRSMLDLSLSMSDPDEVVAALASQYGEDPADLAADLYGLLARLQEEGLVEVSPGIADEVARATERQAPGT